jgi:sialic acid synthase SpsE
LEKEMRLAERIIRGPITTKNKEIAYLVAEAGVNHEGSLDTAKRLVWEAADAGANAIKFQTYKAEKLASKNSPAYWDLSKEPTSSQYKLFKKFDQFSKQDFVTLKGYCDELGIEFLSTPFDIESATYLNELMSVFKISSSDITNKPFIEYLCQFGKPLLISTGAANIDEIDETVGWVEKYEVPLALMHCVLNYPTREVDANLAMIFSLQQRYPHLVIGYSDHTEPSDMRVLETAAVLGATILEKHFTHDRTLPGNDHYHAMDRGCLKKCVQNLERVKLMLGETEKRSLPSEESARTNARRSLVASGNILMGDKINPEDLTWKRPGTGISPKYIDAVAGKLARQDIVEDTIITWEMIT